MGYTHYWSFPTINNKTWARIRAAVEEVVEDVPGLQLEFDNPEPPLIGREEIRFNGRGQYGHETFRVERDNPIGFNFCKTARKPYDEAVTAVLCIVGHHLGAMKGPHYISSDGSFSDWLEGRELATKVLGEDLAFALED